MKKLISVVLVLAMLASMMVYLPLGASAEESAAPETIYSEDFTGKDGTYTLAELATKLGWTLLRGDDAATATIANGVLSINPGTAKDVVFEIVKDARLKSNHTYSYDMTKFNKGGYLFFAGIYTGTDNGETVKAIFNKTTYENYNHMVLVDGVINDTNQGAKGFVIGGGGYEQTRPESIPGGGNTNTWTTVYDVTNNQVDTYASGGRINSTVGNKNFASYNVADYAGEGAYLRVQKAEGASSFDNISIVTGGEAVSYGEYAYYQDFSGIANGTYTGAQLTALTGFTSFMDTAGSNTMTYTIQDGALIVDAAGTAGSFTFKNNPQFASLYIPEMETAKDTVVIEYDMTYLPGTADNGDSPFGIEAYGRRSDFHAFWQFTQKGFPQGGFYKGSYTKDGAGVSITQNGIATTNGYYPQSQARWEDTSFNAKAATYNFSNGSYGHSLMNSTEHIKVVLSITDGMYVYVNGVVAWQLTQAGYEAWTSTLGGGNASHIIGNLLNFRTSGGMTVKLDNFKVTADPAPIAGPALVLTEQSCGVTDFGTATKFGGAEYVEVYNTSTEAINIYDYAFAQRAYNNSCDNVGTAIGLDNIHLMYPGTHTFKSIKTDEETGAPLYTYDIENPAYADGWIQPGELVVLWNKTDSMHNGGYSSPSVLANGMGNWGTKTEADFRAALAIPEGVKVFEMYNDYNRAFNNSGSHIVGLIDRAKVQPGYDPATGTGSEALTNAAIGWADYKSSLLDVTADTNSYRTPQTVTFATYDVTEALGHSSVVFARPSANKNASAMTPGYLTDAQKIALTVTVNGKKNTAYLGESIVPSDYITLEGFQQALFTKVNGVIADASKAVKVLADVTIETGDIVALSTAPGASLRINNDAKFGIRWLTAINTADLEALIAKYGKENVEIGTLIARTEELVEAEQALAIENVYDEETAYDKVVRKAVAYAGEWYPATSDYEGFAIFAGGVGAMQLDYNMHKEYVAVGYISVTIDGETYTLYGAADTTAQTKVLYDMMGEAMGDYELNVEEGTPENSIITEEEYDLINEVYWEY